MPLPKLIAVALVVIPTLAHHPLMGGEPTVSIGFATFYGTEGSTFNTTRAVDVDSDGYAYITGTTASADFLSRPSSGGQVNVINKYVGPQPAVVVKLSPDGSEVIWARFVGVEGPNCWSVGKGARMDESGNVYVACNIKSGDKSTGRDFSTADP